MRTPCNLSYGWSLAFAVTLVIASKSLAQTRPLEVVVKENSANFVAAPEPTHAGTLIDSRSVACRTASEWLPAKQLRQHAQAVQQLYCNEDACTRDRKSVV